MDPRYGAAPAPMPKARSAAGPKRFGVQKSECTSERRVVLEDGTKKCADCADCPKKKADDAGAPKVQIQVDVLATDISRMDVHEVDFTTAF